MCRHIINAQVSINFGGKWYDCHECYFEHEGKALDLKKMPTYVAMACKNCRQLFHKDMRIFSKNDETCPHCGNRFFLPAMTPKSCLLAEANHILQTALWDSLKRPMSINTDLDVLCYEHLISHEERHDTEQKGNHKRRVNASVGAQ